MTTMKLREIRLRVSELSNQNFRLFLESLKDSIEIIEIIGRESLEDWSERKKIYETLLSRMIKKEFPKLKTLIIPDLMNFSFPEIVPVRKMIDQALKLSIS